MDPGICIWDLKSRRRGQKSSKDEAEAEVRDLKCEKDLSHHCRREATEAIEDPYSVGK